MNGRRATPPALFDGTAANGNDTSPRIAASPSGTWIAVRESDDTFGDLTGADDDVLVARSIDDGVTWSAPAVRNTNAAIDAGMDSSPSVATDGAGTWVAVWMSTDPLGGPPKSDFDVLVARSVDGGLTWSAPVPIAGAGATPGFDGSPVVAADDPAAPETVTVDAKKPRHLCAPAGSTPGGVEDAGTHLESVPLRQGEAHHGRAQVPKRRAGDGRGSVQRRAAPRRAREAAPPLHAGRGRRGDAPDARRPLPLLPGQAGENRLRPGLADRSGELLQARDRLRRHHGCHDLLHETAEAPARPRPAVANDLGTGRLDARKDEMVCIPAVAMSP